MKVKQSQLIMLFTKFVTVFWASEKKALIIIIIIEK